METEQKNLLQEAAEKLGINLSEEAKIQFEKYLEELLEWNKVMNLTAITEPKEVVTKHFIDSRSLLSYGNLPQSAKVADVGSGAGFPGIPLKINREDISLTCLDSLNKRITFLKELCKKLGLSGVECIHARAEEAGRQPELREQYDVVTARAVANMKLLAEYCLPLVKPGGIFYAMKGPDAFQEAKGAERAVKLLGGEIKEIKEFTLPMTDMHRTIIIIKKIGQTPKLYPRKSAQMAKMPL